MSSLCLLEIVLGWDAARILCEAGDVLSLSHPSRYRDGFSSLVTLEIGAEATATIELVLTGPG